MNFKLCLPSQNVYTVVTRNPLGDMGNFLQKLWGNSGGIPGGIPGEFRGGIPARNSRDILRNVFFGVILTAPGTSTCRPPSPPDPSPRTPPPPGFGTKFPQPAPSPLPKFLSEIFYPFSLPPIPLSPIISFIPISPKGSAPTDCISSWTLGFIP